MSRLSCQFGYAAVFSIISAEKTTIDRALRYNIIHGKLSEQRFLEHGGTRNAPTEMQASCKSSTRCMMSKLA